MEYKRHGNLREYLGRGGLTEVRKPTNEDLEQHPPAIPSRSKSFKQYRSHHMQRQTKQRFPRHVM